MFFVYDVVFTILWHVLIVQIYKILSGQVTRPQQKSSPGAFRLLPNRYSVKIHAQTQAPISNLSCQHMRGQSCRVLTFCTYLSQISFGNTIPSLSSAVLANTLQLPSVSKWPDRYLNEMSSSDGRSSSSRPSSLRRTRPLIVSCCWCGPGNRALLLWDVY